MMNKNIRQLQDLLESMNEYLLVLENDSKEKYEYRIILETWKSADDYYYFELISFSMNGEYKKEDDYYTVEDDIDGDLEKTLVNFLNKYKKNSIKDSEPALS